MKIDFGRSDEYPYGVQWVAVSKQDLRRRVNSPAEFSTVERLEAAAFLRMTPKTNEAVFRRGELQAILGAGRSTVHDAIVRAVARGTLHPESDSRHLAVRGQVAQAGRGTATQEIAVTAVPFAGVRDRRPEGSTRPWRPWQPSNVRISRTFYRKIRTSYML